MLSNIFFRFFRDLDLDSALSGCGTRFGAPNRLVFRNCRFSLSRPGVPPEDFERGRLPARAGTVEEENKRK